MPNGGNGTYTLAAMPLFSSVDLLYKCLQRCTVWTLLIYLLRFGKAAFLGFVWQDFNMPMFYCSKKNITFRYILYMGRSLSNIVIMQNLESFGSKDIC